MSYTAYSYSTTGSSYDTYSQPYDSQTYVSTDRNTDVPQYDYTSSQSLDQYAQPAAEYGLYNSTTDRDYIMPATSYPEVSSIPSYQYGQDSVPSNSYSMHSIGALPVSYSKPETHYSSAITQETASHPVSDYSSYQYQTRTYDQQTNSYGQETALSEYTGSYTQTSNLYQNEPNHLSGTWTSNDQYTSYNSPYVDESTNRRSYSPKLDSSYQTIDYSSQESRYSQDISIDSRSYDYSKSTRYSETEDSGYHGYVKPISSHVSKSRYDSTTYNTTHPPLGSEYDTGGSVEYSSEDSLVESLSNTSSYSDVYNVPSGNQDSSVNRDSGSNSFINRGRENNNSFNQGQRSAYPTSQTSTAQKSFNYNQNYNQHSGRGFSYNARSYSHRDVHENKFSSNVTSNYGNKSTNVSKKPISTFGARNKTNETRSTSTFENKFKNPSTFGRNVKNSPSINRKVPFSTFKQSESIKKEVFKMPSRPQDRLLNEIEEKEKAEQLKKVEEEKKKNEEEQKKAEEELKRNEEKRLEELEQSKRIAEEELRKKIEEDAVKAAPPLKPPETAEEMAHEEEIQRKIRESLVIMKPDQEMLVLKDDPTKDIEMTDELRKLLKTQTPDHLCRLCSVRIVNHQMATMHYNGKNHLKKVHIFVQTNGRSAGFNMDTLEQTEKDEIKQETAEETKAEIVVIETIIHWHSGQG